MKDKLEKIDKKTLMMMGGFLVLVVVILFAFAFIYNRFFYKKSYEEIETIMLEAAKNHYSENKEMLPKNINDSISIGVDDLVKAEEMKEINYYLKDDTATCDGEVKITNINNNYRYAVFLDCGKKHKTTKFIDYVNENVDIVNSGNGLYNLNDELVYRGDEVNNYIKFSGKTYRIVKFKNEEAVIILTEKLGSYEWDNRYNVEEESNSGINDYSISRIKSTLDDLYEGTSLVSNEDKLLLVSHSIGIGKRSEKDTDKTGSLENSVMLDNQYIGLLQMNDYLNASWDNNCSNSISPSCSNYNYLSKYRYNWWTITADKEESARVFRINTNKAYTSLADGSGYLRPVFHLSKDAIYVSGDGSKEKPYIVK